MKILVVNDDGFHSEGLRALIHELKQEHELTVVVPNLQQSGKSHSLTFLSPLRANYHELPYLEHGAWVVDGTPADCAKLGLEYLMKEPPELVLSGINLGLNVGNDVIYSGTVSAAYEGYIRGFRTMAVSAGGDNLAGWDFTAAAKTFGRLLPHLLKDKKFFYNINIPCIPMTELAGVRKTYVGERHFSETVVRRVDPYGRDYFWNFCDNSACGEPEEGSDLWAVNKGYVSITPLKPVYFDREYFNEMPSYSSLGNVLKDD